MTRLKGRMGQGIRTLRRRWSFWRTRPSFTYAGLHLEVSNGVVNPSLFTASKVFASESLKWLPASPVDLLELGCGCGLATLLAAKNGHRVTAVDLDLQAVENAKANAARNGILARILHSDWDHCLDEDQKYERIICNPPFLKGTGGPFAMALKAGAHWEVLHAVAQTIGRRLKTNGLGLIMTSSQTDRDAWLEAVISVRGLAIRPHRKRWHWQERLLFDEVYWDRK